MTTLTHTTATGEAVQRPPRIVVGVGIVAVIAGLALGRFLFLVPSTVPTRPAVAAPEDRLAALERAVAEDPTDLGALQQLGVAATDAAIASGDPALYELAGDAFDRADAVAADHPDTLVGRGLALSLHDFSQALRLGERAVQARPDHAPSLGVVVDAQVELGHYDRAASTLQRMLDVRPDLAALARTSYLRELHGDLDGAALALRQAEAAGSASPQLERATVAALAGDLALRRGDVDAAAAAYDRAAALAPDLPAVTVGVARVRAAGGQVDAAIDGLREAAERRPVPAVLMLSSDLLHRAGRAQEAADVDALVRASADLARAVGQVVDLEMARFEADRVPARGVEPARAAHDERPDNVFAADALAWALYRSGDVSGAAELVDEALRLGTADAGMRARAALILDAAGDRARARTELGAAFGGSPLDAIAQHRDLLALAGRLGVAVPEPWTLP